MAGNILDQLADYARQRVAADREKVSLETLQHRCAEGAFPPRQPLAFERALAGPETAFICEVKKASPSKGIIAPDFPYREIARAYQAAGAECISCLTEPKWFLGSDQIFQDIRQEISIPMLRKDFTVDAYQIYQAKLMGADAVLLIVALLGEETLRQYLRICETLGLSALVETHDPQELRTALRVGTRIIGVNNRNLKDFSVDTGNARRLRELAPPEVLFVAESGIRTAEEVAELQAAGVNAVLIGETLMRAADKGAMLAHLRGGAGRKETE